MTDKVDTTVEQRRTQLDALEGEAKRRQGVLDTQRAASDKAFDTQMTGSEADLTQAMAQPLPTAPQPTDIGPPPSRQHLVNKEHYQGLAFGLLAMALVGGKASHDNWMGVASTLNGALRGLKEGANEQAQRQLDEYNTKFQAARAHDADLNKKFMNILEARDTSINQKREQMKILAAQHGREDIRFAAEQGSIDRMIQQVNAGRNALDGVVQRHEDVMLHVTIEKDKINASQQGGRNATFTPEEAAWAAQYEALTGKKVTAWGGGNAVVKSMLDQGITPAQVASGTAEFGALNAALRYTAIRQAGVERLTNSLQKLEPAIIKTAQKVGLTNEQFINKPLNALRAQFGDEKLAELKTMVAAWGRQYMEAVTMPGSNAQLHVSSAELGDAIMNTNMSIRQMMGSMHGANTDVAAGKYGLDRKSVV